jgi:hypothetical protein
MTFEWLNKQGVKSSDGFEVQCTDRYAFEYREGKRVVTVPVEIGFIGNTPCVSFSHSAFKQWDRSTLTNPSEVQATMIKNFKAALAFQGLIVDD